MLLNSVLKGGIHSTKRRVSAYIVGVFNKAEAARVTGQSGNCCLNASISACGGSPVPRAKFSHAS